MIDPFARAEVTGAQAMLDALAAEGLIVIDQVNQAIRAGSAPPRPMALFDRTLASRLPSWRPDE